MPSITGIRTSMSTTSGARVRDELDGLCARARLADHHELLGVQEGDKRVTEGRVVVHHQHAKRGGTAEGALCIRMTQV